MNILVVDQCSKAKTQDENTKPYTVDEVDSHSLTELRDRPQTPVLKARKLYAGRQQQFINQAVDRLREGGDTVDRYFISAGFGVVEETELLPSYDVTFSSYSTAEIRERAGQLNIQDDLLELVGRDYDLVYLALGADYYASFDLATLVDRVPSDTWIVCFNHESLTTSLENAVSISARTEDAKAQGTITVALKGKYLQNFAEHRSHGCKVETAEDIVQYCTTEETTQSNLGDNTF